MLDKTCQQMAIVARFVTAACCYWIGTYPAIRKEIGRMRRRAARIPDPALRHLALNVLESKWGNLEGAGAFAAFAPIRVRARVARLLVNLQGIYDYVDILAEQPSQNLQADAITLHSAMLDALEPGSPTAAYYAYHNPDDDGGYLTALVKRCRATVEQLPAYPLVAEAAREHTQRIIDYQARINHDREHQYASFATWAETETPAGTGLYWWETGAACGSSLALLALLAAAADPTLTLAEAAAIEATYWPWAGALHTLLDNLVDRDEDCNTGQHNLTDHYVDKDEIAQRFGLLISKAVECAEYAAPHHHLILAGMVGLYLSEEQAWTPIARPAAERILLLTGFLAKLAMLLLHARRLALKARRQRLSSSSTR